MNWFNKLFNKSSGGGSYFLNGSCGYSINYSGEIANSLELAYKRNCALLSAIINRHSKDISEIEFGEVVNEAVIPVQSSPTLSGYCLDKMIGKHAGDVDLDGNVYIEKTGSAYRRIKPVNIDWVDLNNIIITRAYGRQTSYKKNPITGNFETNQGGITGILYHKNLLDTIDNETGRGESPVLPIQNEILMNIYANQHNSTYLRKGMKSDMLIMLDEDLSEEAFKSFKKEFLAKHAGADNAGTPLVLSGSKGTVKDMQGKTKDMDFKNLLEKAEQNIAVIYDIPLPLIISSNQTFNNYQEAELNYYKKSALPLMKFLVKWYNEIFETEMVINKGSIDVLRKEMIANSSEMSKAGIYSVNEAREIAGYGEIDGGDQIFRPASDIPIGDDGGIEVDGE